MKISTLYFVEIHNDDNITCWVEVCRGMDNRRVYCRLSYQRYCTWLERLSIYKHTLDIARVKIVHHPTGCNAYFDWLEGHQ